MTSSYDSTPPSPYLIPDNGPSISPSGAIINPAPGFVPTPQQMGVFNVKTYGAIGNGVTDDSAAIIAAVVACFTYGNTNNPGSNSQNVPGASGGIISNAAGIVYFPPGVYRVTQNNVLGTKPVDTHGLTPLGIIFRGAGMYTSVLLMDSSAATAPMYFGYFGGATSTCNGMVIEDLGFYGGTPGQWLPTYRNRSINPSWTYAEYPTYSYGFYISALNSGNFNSGCKFFRCCIGGVQIAFDFEGLNLASEMTHIGCCYDSAVACYQINNEQSDDHWFFGCTFTTYGAAFLIGANGCGNIAVYGGLVTVQYNGLATNTWVIDASNGIVRENIVFDNFHIELYGAYSNLLNVLQGNGIGPVTIRASFLLDHLAAGSKPDWCVAGELARVVLEDCLLGPTGSTVLGFQIINSTFLQYVETGSIHLKGCILPANFSDACIVGPNGGMISAVDCSTVGGVSSGAYLASDFDYNADVAYGQVTNWSNSAAVNASGGMGNLQPRKKTAWLLAPFNNLPTTTAGVTLYLPKNALITKITFMKPGGGTATTSVTFNVTSLDGSTTTHLSVGAAAANAAFYGVIDYEASGGGPYAVGDTTNQRKLLLAPSVNINGSSDVWSNCRCTVEYY